MQPDAGIRRLALLVEYEGTAYGGSQYQKTAPTVQGALERALSNLTGEPIRVTMAGRTDRGVHATGQVASFVTHSRRSVETVTSATGALLPRDISVRAVEEVPVTFDPRRHARSRRYEYTIHVGRGRPAISRNFVWHVGRPLRTEAMSEAAALLVGTHDFAAFTSPSEAKSRATVRVVFRTEMVENGETVSFRIEANAFLRHMVRRIVSTLAAVGSGKMDAATFATILRDAQPGTARPMAPASGLCLAKVYYENGLFDDETNENI